MAYSSHDYDDLQPADKLKIERSIFFNEENSDISPLTAFPLEQLQAMRGESAAAEQEIYERLRVAAAEWEERAGETLLIDKAIEYARTPPVKHTANQWETEYGRHTVSNMVYRMNHHISEHTEYDRKAQKYVPVAWHVSWSVHTNAPERNRTAIIAGQERKRYNDRAEAEKYLDGRVKAYSHLFTEISPPIPQEYRKCFTVNGQLLPGYAVQGEEPLSGKNEQRKEPTDMNEPLTILLTNREMYTSREGGNAEGAWLKLPATAGQLAAALSRIGAQGGEQGGDYFIGGIETPVAAFKGMPLENWQKAGIDELNRLAAGLEGLDAKQIAKLNAAIEAMESRDDIRRLAELTQNLDAYDFHPDIFDHVQLGEHTLEHSGMIQIPAEWEAAIDVNMLGELAAEHENGHFTEHGYIVPNGTEWKPVAEIPQERRIAPEPEQPGRGDEKENPNADYEAAASAPAAAFAAAPIVLVADNPRDRMKEITDKLEQGIKGIFDSEKYKAFLATMAKFHNYSFNNCLLIAMQKPDSTRIAGFNAWRDDFKRPVKKGEKGMKIFAPAPFTVKKETEKIDPHTRKPVIGKDGKPVMEETETKVPAFKIVSVFDVSQTDGEPLPEIGVSELAGSVDRYGDFFAALEKTSRVPVGFEKIGTGAKGYYEQADKRIAINEGMSELQNLKTLIHEIAHSRIHDMDKNAPITEPRPDRRTREVEAESIAFAVCAHYGLDTSDYSFGYVASWSGEKQLDALKSSLDTIRREANAIITEVDKHFAEITQGKEQAAEQTAEISAPESGDTFTIYQLKDGDDTRDLRFEPLAGLKRPPDAANYEQAYAAPLDKDMTLEK